MGDEAAAAAAPAPAAAADDDDAAAVGRWGGGEADVRRVERLDGRQEDERHKAVVQGLQVELDEARAMRDTALTVAADVQQRKLGDQASRAAAVANYACVNNERRP